MDHGGTRAADGIDPVPDEDDTAVIPAVPATGPGPDSTMQSAPSGSVRSPAGAHRRVEEDEETARRRPPGRGRYLLAVAAALGIGLLAAVALTIPRTRGPVMHDPAAPLARVPGGEATDRFGPAVSATPGATTPSRSALPGSRSPAASPSATRPTPTRPAAPTSRPTGSPSRTAGPAWTALTVTATKALFRGDSVQTNRTRLVMRADGNLVIIDENGATRWTSGTAGRGSQATFQADGNFVVYDAYAQPLWSSRTDRHNGAVLVLQANGDVCVVDHGTPVWCAGTGH
jgi:hypothetical protein